MKYRVRQISPNWFAVEEKRMVLPGWKQLDCVNSVEEGQKFIRQISNLLKLNWERPISYSCEFGIDGVIVAETGHNVI